MSFETEGASFYTATEQTETFNPAEEPYTFSPTTPPSLFGETLADLASFDLQTPPGIQEHEESLTEQTPLENVSGYSDDQIQKVLEFEGTDLLSQQRREKYESIKQTAVVAGYPELERQFRQNYLSMRIPDIGTHLRVAGGIGVRKLNLVYVDSNFWPGMHADFVVEHEVTELLYAERQEEAQKRLERLGLLPEGGIPGQKPNYAHLLAVVYEFTLAKKRDMLDEHMQMHEEAQQRILASENGDRFRSRFQFNSEYRDKVKALLDNASPR